LPSFGAAFFRRGPPPWSSLRSVLGAIGFGISGSTLPSSLRLTLRPVAPATVARCAPGPWRSFWTSFTGGGGGHHFVITALGGTSEWLLGASMTRPTATPRCFSPRSGGPEFKSLRPDHYSISPPFGTAIFLTGRRDSMRRRLQAAAAGWQTLRPDHYDYRCPSGRCFSWSSHHGPRFARPLERSASEFPEAIASIPAPHTPAGCTGHGG